jgi:16S rRNA (uracil1498-N3)-methyltransferase
MRLFYSQKIENNTIWLADEEFHHCKNVLRLKVGSLVHVIDGKGHLYEAEIVKYTKTEAELSILITKFFEKSTTNKLQIAIAPTKNIDRIEWFVEKATEMGIDEISFVRTKRTERKNINLERITKIAISAAKQSNNYYLPLLHDLEDLNTFILSNKNTQAIKLIPHLVEGQDRMLLKDFLLKFHSFIVLIGPEGDFTPEEVKLALDTDYKPISLGALILRTETAALAATTLIKLNQ